MNKAAILLGVVSVGLVVAMVMRSQRAGAQLEAAHANTASVSNQLSEAQVKLNHNEQLNTALKSQLSERDAGLGGLSNNVSQLRTSLTAARTETDAARAEIGPVNDRATAFAVERDGFSNRVSELETTLRTLEERAQSADERTAKVHRDLTAVSQQLAATQLEQRRLEKMLGDSEALQARLEEIRKAETVAKTPAPDGKPDYRFAARLAPDGTVSLEPPPYKKSEKK